MINKTGFDILIIETNAKGRLFMKISEPTTSHLLLYSGLSQWKLFSTPYIIHLSVSKFNDPLWLWPSCLPSFIFVKDTLVLPEKLNLIKDGIAGKGTFGIVQKVRVLTKNNDTDDAGKNY